MTVTIADIKGRAILDSRGVPAVEAEVFLSDGSSAAASVPSGGTLGVHEALELRDGDPACYNGKGVKKAVAHINEKLVDELVGFPAAEQSRLDRRLIELDGTPRKKNLGANALLAVSMGVCKAVASSQRLPLYRYLGGIASHILPVPMISLLCGGPYAGNGVDLQDYMILPVGFYKFSDALAASSEIYSCMKDILIKRGLSTAVGETGGFIPRLKENREGLDLLVSAVEAAGYTPGADIFFALDIAAGNLFQKGHYRFEGKEMTSLELGEIFADWTKSFPIVSIEDPAADDDWAGWKSITEKLGKDIQIVGDDLFATNVQRLMRGTAEGCANALLVKPNQIGTVTETIEVATLAQRSGYAAVVSHRSGETEETFIADLAVGLNSFQIKAGAVTRSERTCKYNRLLRIEEELGDAAVYGGASLKK